MVNCELNQIRQSPIVTIDKIETGAGEFLHQLDKNYISNVIFEVCEGAYFFKFTKKQLKLFKYDKIIAK